METAKKSGQQVEEQQWENPLNPEKPGDERGREQLERQFKEAKRRNENLSTDDNNKQTKN